MANKPRKRFDNQIRSTAWTERPQQPMQKWQDSVNLALPVKGQAGERPGGKRVERHMGCLGDQPGRARTSSVRKSEAQVFARMLLRCRARQRLNKQGDLDRPCSTSPFPATPRLGSDDPHYSPTDSDSIGHASVFAAVKANCRETKVFYRRHKADAPTWLRELKGDLLT